MRFRNTILCIILFFGEGKLSGSLTCWSLHSLSQSYSLKVGVPVLTLCTCPLGGGLSRK